jgi:hypothetical protein
MARYARCETRAVERIRLASIIDFLSPVVQLSIILFTTGVSPFYDGCEPVFYGGRKTVTILLINDLRLTNSLHFYHSFYDECESGVRLA